MYSSFIYTYMGIASLFLCAFITYSGLCRSGMANLLKTWYKWYVHPSSMLGGSHRSPIIGSKRRGRDGKTHPSPITVCHARKPLRRPGANDMHFTLTGMNV